MHEPIYYSKHLLKNTERTWHKLKLQPSTSNLKPVACQIFEQSSQTKGSWAGNWQLIQRGLCLTKYIRIRKRIFFVEYLKNKLSPKAIYLLLAFTWNPKTIFNSFPLNHVTAYVFCATARDSPPIPNTNRPICMIVKLPSIPPPANITWPSRKNVMKSFTNKF